MTRKPFRRVLAVERLDERHLMAGDVTAVANGQVLTLTGDVLGNGIIVTGLSGQIQVTGFEHDGDRTTVNSDHRATFKNIQQIVVDLGTGDDAFVFTNANFKNSAAGQLRLTGTGPTSGVTIAAPKQVSLSLQMGDGDDIVGLGQFDNLTDIIDPFTGLPVHLLDETIEPLLKPLSLSRDVKIDMGDGENILRATAVTVGQNLSVAMGTDDDELRLESRGVLGRAGFLPGVTVGLTTTISTSDGDDELRLTRFATRALNLSSGADHDRVNLLNVSVTQDSSISGGEGFDTIRLEGYSTKKLTVSAGEGDDDVFVKNTQANKATIDGGPGDNIYHDLGGNANLRSLTLLNFDTIVGSSTTAKKITRFRVSV